MLTKFSKLIFAGNYANIGISDGSSILDESFFNAINYEDVNLFSNNAGIRNFRSSIIISVELCLFAHVDGASDDVYLLNKYTPVDSFNSFKNISVKIPVTDAYNFWRGEFIVYPNSTLCLQSKTNPSVLGNIIISGNQFNSDSTIVIYQKLP